MKRIFAIVLMFMFTALFMAGCTKAVPNESVFPTATAIPSVISTPTVVPTVEFYFMLEPVSGNLLDATINYGVVGNIKTMHFNLDYSSYGTIPFATVGVIYANWGDLYEINVSGSSIPLILKVYKKGDDGNPIYFYEETGLAPRMEKVLQ